MPEEMPNIVVSRYDEPTAGWLGWVEPEAGGDWILFIHKDGGASLFDRTKGVVVSTTVADQA